MSEKQTCKSAMRELMSSGGWWTLWGLQESVKAKTGKFYGESVISARMRELSHEKRRREDNHGYEYRLVPQSLTDSLLIDEPIKLPVTQIVMQGESLIVSETEFCLTPE